MPSKDPRSGWKRLEETLLAIRPGETVTVEALATECGLARETVEQLLAEVIKSELFERRDDGSVARCGIVETTTFSESDGRASIVSGGDKNAGTAKARPPKREKPTET
jgi:hypothetical protein